MIQIDRNPSANMLRVFSAAWIVFFGCLGAAVYHKSGLLPRATWILSIAGTIGLAGVLVPRLIKPVYLAACYATFPIGFVLSYVLTGLIYYLVLTPVGLVMRLVGRDPMTRRFDPSATTYWVRRKPTTGTERYFRQF